MKFALLGADLPALTLARAVAESHEHELVWAGELGEAGPLFRALAPQAVQSDAWESLLAAAEVDAVIVARAEDDDQRADQLRKLVQEGIPLLVSHPIHGSMLVCYELDMIRRESGGVLLPYLPWRGHPAVERMRSLVADESAAGLGRLEQVVVERAMADRDKSKVTAQFAIDIDLVRFLAGELTKIGAMAPAGADERYANLGVQLSGPGNVLVRWSVGPVEERAGARIMLVARGGKATLFIPQDDGPWTLEVLRGDRRDLQEFAAWNAAAESIRHMQRAIAGEEVHPDWIDACRCIELAESIDRSLNKGRTLELYYEDYSEQATFKGTMTSLGCGLLVAALAVLPVAAIAARLGVPLARYWAWILLAVFTLFLLLQGLRLVFPSAEKAEKER